MAKIEAKAVITASITLSLTESEAKALSALAGYGDDDFLKVYYEKLGRHYLQPHEGGLRSLFTSVRHLLPAELDKVHKAREALKG